MDETLLKLEGAIKQVEASVKLDNTVHRGFEWHKGFDYALSEVWKVLASCSDPQSGIG